MMDGMLTALPLPFDLEDRCWVPLGFVDFGLNRTDPEARAPVSAASWSSSLPSSKPSPFDSRSSMSSDPTSDTSGSGVLRRRPLPLKPAQTSSREAERTPLAVPPWLPADDPLAPRVPFDLPALARATSNAVSLAFWGNLRSIKFWMDGFASNWLA